MNLYISSKKFWKLTVINMYNKGFDIELEYETNETIELTKWESSIELELSNLYISKTHKGVHWMKNKNTIESTILIAFKRITFDFLFSSLDFCFLFVLIGFSKLNSIESVLFMSNRISSEINSENRYSVNEFVHFFTLENFFFFQLFKKISNFIELIKIIEYGRIKLIKYLKM